MSNQRLQGWNPQKTGFTYAKDREFGPGLRGASLYADLGLAEATGGQFHGEIIKIFDWGTHSCRNYIFIISVKQTRNIR